MKTKTFAALLVCMLLFNGCLWLQERKDKPARDLAIDGMEYMKKGQYVAAKESFEQLKDWYPFSKFAILAELKLGDANYYLKEYGEAVAAYEHFENLHPRNEAIPYVIYQIGRSYFDQIDTLDRDQATARKAIDAFQRLIQQYPNTDYARKADGHIKECIQSMAGHELHVGLYYFQGKQYKAAMNRFRAVLTDYPDVGLHYMALQYIALCEKALQKQEKDN